MQARSTANGKIRSEIQNPQTFETDPKQSFSHGHRYLLYLLNRRGRRNFVLTAAEILKI
jgi:hypothetical protein